MKLVSAIVVAALLAASPFAAYAALKSLTPDAQLPWPSPVALAATSGEILEDLGLLDFGSETKLVVFPPETLLPVPGVGELTASRALRITGPGSLAAGLHGLLGLDVPYFLHGEGSDLAEALRAASGNAGAHEEDIADAVEDVLAGRGRLINPLGRASGPGFAVDVEKLLGELQGAAPDVEPLKPSPVPTPSPAVTATSVTVEVLNAGGPAGSATRTADTLRPKGFQISRVGDFLGAGVDATKVYFREEKVKGELVARAISGSPEAEPLPSSITTQADVLVLVGPNAD